MLRNTLLAEEQFEKIGEIPEFPKVTMKEQNITSRWLRAKMARSRTTWQSQRSQISRSFPLLAISPWLRQLRGPRHLQADDDYTCGILNSDPILKSITNIWLKHGKTPSSQSSEIPMGSNKRFWKYHNINRIDPLENFEIWVIWLLSFSTLKFPDFQIFLIISAENVLARTDPKES